MEELIKNASLMAAVIALAFVIVGLLQWVVAITKSSDKRHNELIEQLTEAKLENARLKGQLIIYSDKLGDMSERLKEAKNNYRHFKELYEATQIPHDPPPKPPSLN
jgi:F0F1-type ATP synthase membrane subunit b/b'